MTNHDPAFWQAIYDAESRPGWDLRGPSPLLPELLDQVEALGLRTGPRIVVPGCGFGHDAAELARRGLRATGVDFATAAIEGARERYGDLAEWRQEDWFAPGPERYEALFDYTCFVAMAPEARARYVDACAERLEPGGLWLGGFFHTVTGPTCPPYPVSEAELRALAEPRFEILHLGPATRSHPRRAGREFLLVARKREPVRCRWCGQDPLYVAYHDREWGVPSRDDRHLFEMLILEGAQAGLSWITVLRKREAYRRLFADFDPQAVAAFDPERLQAILQDPGIVRNRLKVASAVINARAFLDVQREFGSFHGYLWGFVGGRPKVNRFASPGSVPAVTPEAEALSRDLKKRGFKFVGATIIYAYMQAVGLVDDHLADCFRSGRV